MKRKLGAASLGGLAALGLLAFPEPASAAPGGAGPAPSAKGGAPPGQAPAPARSNAPAAKPSGPAAKPSGPAAKPNKPAASSRSNGASSTGRATGQARAAAVRKTPPAAAARSNRPGSPNRATGQARAAYVQSLNAAKAEQRAQAAAAQAAAAPGAAAVPVAAAAPLAAAPVTSAAAAKVFICHATNSETSPWELIEIPDPALPAHLDNHGDVAPVNGACPSPIVPPAPGGTVAICHRTGSADNPFELITVTDVDLAGHVAHGDVGTVAGACPGAPVVLPDMIVRPDVVPGVRVLGVQARVLDTVRTQSRASFIVPVAGANGLVSGRVSEQGSLPVTGIDIGALVLMALALVVAGSGLAWGGTHGSAVAAGPVGSPTTPGGTRSRSDHNDFQANAPPGVPRLGP